MRRVVMFSGGIGSWAAARRIADRFGVDDLTLLFCDTRMEDEDLYRFIHEAAKDICAPLEIIADGRTPWQVFHDERFLGTSRIDPCSKILKRKLADRWLDEHCDKSSTVVYTGIDWSEIHRHERLAKRRAESGWRYEAPMTEPPYIDKPQMIKSLRERGIDPPRLYSMGFAHNNCGGFCVKAGQGHFSLLYRAMPDRYKQHEQYELEFQRFIGRDVTILSETVNGESINLSLSELRRRIDQDKQIDLFDIGGCGCFLDGEDS